MKTALFLLAALLLFVGFCQSGKQFTVISTSGVNLRSKPSLQSNIIKALPWGTKVRVTEVVSEEKVNLGVHHAVDLGNDGNLDTIYLSGRWVKAKYGEFTGYLFDAFLLETSSKRNTKLPDYALLFESYSCFYNLDFDPNWNWYGLYEKDGGQFLKKVSISCLKYAEDELDFGDFLCISTKERTESKFIIGSRKPLNMDSFKQAKGEYPMNFHGPASIDVIQPVARKIGLDVAVVKRTNIDDQTFDRCILYALGENGQRQSLELLDDNQGEWILSDLVWAGDLDGDGKNDYVVHYGEVSAVTILYLSSIAPKGQLVKEAARWFSGYCC